MAKVNTAAQPKKLAEFTHLKVRALVPGFRRAGRAWGTEEVTVPADEFSAEEIDALLAESQLVVTPTMAEKPESDGK